MSEGDYVGLLFVGDPHLEGRQPGFRKDDYPNVILNKLRWCLDYAEQERLLPAILGDLFEKPRDNPNWMLVHLLGMLRGEVLTLYGNHDVHYNPELTPDDSLSILVRAGRIRLISPEEPWAGTINGRAVVIGGSSYRQEIPKKFEADCAASPPLVIWLTHHDIQIPGYDDGRIAPREIPGIDLVINGHIHRRLQDVGKGRTTWITPGNISRRSRNDISREHTPAVLRVDVTSQGFQPQYITVPHEPFDEVFHEGVMEAEVGERRSEFVAGLADLQARRTASGAGLVEFLERNLTQFEAPVADEIWKLAHEVIDDESN